MTNKEIKLIDRLNYENRDWQITAPIEIETELFFGATTNEIIEGPIIYCYIEKDMESRYERIARDTIGYDRFKIIEYGSTIFSIAIYMLDDTKE